ncbi:hypothetical protein IQ264_28405 [Phormidium sp. LEGE 05292]|uniref:hypothetical protein n=1 Tax=[Phormidium] sp. LEGE 05292 TaxID=767427 RepID=UPI00187E6A4A|nr:hypothetical protein [Phormidium sp. LEGE 05292]MBE9229332.1 hypothetical protein [Phormidium sp. LEGE 05292]
MKQNPFSAPTTLRSRSHSLPCANHNNHYSSEDKLYFSPGKASVLPTIIFQQLHLNPLKYIHLLTQVYLTLKRIFSVAL